MNLTREYCDEIVKVAKKYDKATGEERKALGRKLDELANPLSEGQLRQVAKIVARA